MGKETAFLSLQERGMLYAKLIFFHTKYILKTVSSLVCIFYFYMLGVYIY